LKICSNFKFTLKPKERNRKKKNPEKEKLEKSLEPRKARKFAKPGKLENSKLLRVNRLAQKANPRWRALIHPANGREIGFPIMTSQQQQNILNLEYSSFFFRGGEYYSNRAKTLSCSI
jgi:hypothetical protein